MFLLVFYGLFPISINFALEVYIGSAVFISIYFVHDADSRAERVERHSNQIILPHFGITSFYFFVSYPRHFHLDGSKTCFFSRILSFYLSTLELYSEKIFVQYSLKKRVILISHIFRIGSTKSTFFLFYIFSPIRFLVLTIFQQ